MKNLLKITLIISLATFMSCQEKKSGYTIKGKITISDEWKRWVYLIEQKSLDYFFSGSLGDNTIDSAYINDDNTFIFSGDSLPTENVFYRLSVCKKGSPPWGIRELASGDNYIFLILNKNSNIEITGNADSLSRTYVVSGTEDCKLIKKLTLLREGEYKLFENFFITESTPGIDLDSLELAFIHQLKIFFKTKIIPDLKNFIDTVQNKNIAVLAANYLSDKGYLPMNENLYYYDSLDKMLMGKLPNNKYVQELHGKVIEAKKDPALPIGSTAPEIVLNTPDGTPITLSSLKGKIVLVDFWASWCNPCRKENKETVLPLYKKYKDQGFEVYSVSLDTDKEKWMTAIEQDNAIWIQVSDLKAKKSPAVIDYKVGPIPQTYLIDKEGKILYRDKRGVELRVIVDKLFDSK